MVGRNAPCHQSVLWDQFGRLAVMSVLTFRCFELSLWVIYACQQTHSSPVLLANPREGIAYSLFLPCHTYILWANPEVKAPPEQPRSKQLVPRLAVGTTRWCDTHLVMTCVSQPNRVRSHPSLLSQITPYTFQSSYVLSAQRIQTVILLTYIMEVIRRDQ